MLSFYSALIEKLIFNGFWFFKVKFVALGFFLNKLKSAPFEYPKLRYFSWIMALSWDSQNKSKNLQLKNTKFFVATSQASIIWPKNSKTFGICKTINLYWYTWNHDSFKYILRNKTKKTNLQKYPLVSPMCNVTNHFATPKKIRNWGYNYCSINSERPHGKSYPL